MIAHGRGCSTTAKLDVLGRRTWPLFCYHHHRWWTENIWSVEKEEGTNIWRRKIFGQRKKWRKRGKTRHLKQGPEQEPSSPNQNDMILILITKINQNDMILITSTWSSGQSKAPESWARTARMSKANGAHEILLNKMDLGGGYFTGWFFIGPESDHWECLSVTHWLTNCCLVNLIDVTLACEDANSKLVEVLTVAHVDAEDHVGNSLLQILKLMWSWCDPVTSIKFTKSYGVGEWVSESVRERQG